MENAGRASYVERNYWMVDDSDFVIMYFKVKSEERLRSGVRVAYEYAKKRIKKELGVDEIKVVATGGLGEIIAKEVKLINLVDRTLTLDGLKIIYELNK